MKMRTWLFALWASLLTAAAAEGHDTGAPHPHAATESSRSWLDALDDPWTLAMVIVGIIVAALAIRIGLRALDRILAR